jgi:threonine synthase
LARLISYFARKRQTIIRVLVATSGDTGGAVAHGFANLENVQVYVLFPKNKVSQLQEKQLTCVAENVWPIEVEGYFDDCQAMVKQAFNDPDLQPLNLTSANSINLGRLIPQIIYHLWVWTQLPESELQLVIPSGNFGNLAAAFLAMKMGVPISRFVAGVNANDTVYRFMQTGKYEPRPTVSTLSNAMDISNPSNFSRILKIVNYDRSNLQQYLQVFRVTDQETTETILEVYNKYNYLLCPHTAVAWKAANLSEHMGLTQVVYATASPYKFAKEISAAAGLVIDDNQLIQQWSTKSSKKVSIAANYSELKQVLQASA